MSLPEAEQGPVVLTTKGALELPPPGVTVKLELKAAVAGTPPIVSAAWLSLVAVASCETSAGRVVVAVTGAIHFHRAGASAARHRDLVAGS